VLGTLRAILAENISSLRKKRGWTQHDLAAAVGLSAEAIRGYEQKRKWPDPEIIEAIAGALDTDPTALFGASSSQFTEQETAEALLAVDQLLAVLERHAPSGALAAHSKQRKHAK
jgi:transcriptional regulator with XRE-family HTH domain